MDGDQKMTREQFHAIDRGYRAVAQVLWADHVSNAEAGEQAKVDEFIDLAKKCVNAWSLATNPVGRAETIYNEYHRLVRVARLVLKEYDENARIDPMVEDSMEALRAMLISLGVIE
jgi:hypothetical protein